MSVARLTLPGPMAYTHALLGEVRDTVQYYEALDQPITATLHNDTVHFTWRE